jgi:hypothetical protein
MQQHEPGATTAQAARIALYSEPKKGKTRLMTSLPWGHPMWGDRAVYVAWDAGSAALEPVQLEDRPHLHRVTPSTKVVKKVVIDPETKKPTTVDELQFDPLEEAVTIAKYPWAKEGFKTLLWDTMTATAEDLLRAIAAGRGVEVSKSHGQAMTVGTPGTDTYVPQPAPADFGSAQTSIDHILKILFQFQSDVNLIIAFHAADNLGDDEHKGDPLGGPATVGKAQIRKIAKLFDNLFRIAVDKTRVPQTMPPQYVIRRVVQTDTQSYWLTGMRNHLNKNPIPVFDIDDNKCRDFWLKFMEVSGR